VRFITLGASGRYYRRFIDMSSRRAVAKSFELSQKRHFWPASKSRAREPPKTSSGGSCYVSTPHISCILNFIHIHTVLCRDEANRERHASPAHNRFVSLTNCGFECVMCAGTKSCRLTTATDTHVQRFGILRVRW